MPPMKRSDSVETLPKILFQCCSTLSSLTATARGVASFSKVRGMDVVCLLTIKTMNTMTEGYKRYNIQDIKSFPFK